MKPLADLFAHFPLLKLMAARDLRARYAGSLIGVFWSLLNPLLLLIVFTFIFAVVFKARFTDRPGIGPSALYILCGILPWLAFADGLGRSATVILENKNLVTRARFPLPVLPAFPALSSIAGQAGGFLVLLVISVFAVGDLSASIVLLPALVILQLLFTVGLCLAAAAVASYLRDLAHVLPVLLIVWMYATPVFYPASMVPARYQLVISLNPIARLIGAYRDVILDGAWPSIASIAAIAFAAALSLIIGSALFQKLTPGIADRI